MVVEVEVVEAVDEVDSEDEVVAVAVVTEAVVTAVEVRVGKTSVAVVKTIVNHRPTKLH